METKKKKEEKISIPKTKLQVEHIKLLIAVFLLALTLIGVIALTTHIKKQNPIKNNNEEIKDNNESNKKDENNKYKLTVYDEDSNERPLAVMIPNDGSAKKRQYGIQKAYLVYEITVEGGITRLMALFKDVDVSKIGPVRSSRHYYLDYVLENDAIYTHFGWSTYAQEDIPKLGINNLNGLYNPSNMFSRDKNYSAPNNAFTSTDKIKKAAESKKYRMTSNNYQLLNYVEKVDMSQDETFKTANNVKINYGGSAYVKYVYNPEKEYYLRYNNENKHIDLETEKQVHVKNILILKVDNKTISGDAKGCQNLYNIGKGDGYYISNGQSIKIRWEKDKRDSKTKYKNLKGEEIQINDGNTFIQIQPPEESIVIE